MSTFMPTLWRDLEDWFGVERFPAAGQVIRVEDYLQDGEYVLRAELPGMDPAKDVTVKIENGVLKVEAERREETHAKHRTEFRYGAFHRYITLPEGADADKIQARYDKGILTITVPISSPTALEGRKVPIEIAT